MLLTPLAPPRPHSVAAAYFHWTIALPGPRRHATCKPSWRQPCADTASGSDQPRRHLSHSPGARCHRGSRGSDLSLMLLRRSGNRGRCRGKDRGYFARHPIDASASAAFSDGGSPGSRVVRSSIHQASKLMLRSRTALSAVVLGRAAVRLVPSPAWSAAHARQTAGSSCSALPALAREHPLEEHVALRFRGAGAAGADAPSGKETRRGATGPGANALGPPPYGWVV